MGVMDNLDTQTNKMYQYLEWLNFRTQLNTYLVE